MKLLLVDDDPIFRLGFSTGLAQKCDWAIATHSFSSVLAEKPELDLDVILCDPAWQGDRHWLRYLKLQALHPNTPLVLLTAQIDPERLLQAKRDGIAGYLPKGMAIASLLPELRRLSSGGKAWSQQPKSINQNYLAAMRRRGLQQIYNSLDHVEGYLSRSDLDPLYRWIFAGQQRELQTAAWLLRRWFPQSTIYLDREGLSSEPQPQVAALTTVPPVEITTTNSRWQEMLEQTFSKLDGPLHNRVSIRIALEILTLDKQRELLYIILQQLNFIFNNPQWDGLGPEQFKQQQQRSIRNLWKFSAQEFIGRHQLGLDSPTETFVELLNRMAIAKAPHLLQDSPQTYELFAYLLRDQPLIIENVSYRLEARESISRSLLILENLLITVGNHVVQFMLNTLPEATLVQAELYQAKFLSSRKIARFRNDLTWHYRHRQIWLEPKAIFESEYQLFCFGPTGITQMAIFQPRYKELSALRGIPWLVTILLEFRDALAPRVRAVVSWLGEILVYLLTNVVGRALGLIARGIVDGAGSSWQSFRSRQLRPFNPPERPE